MRQRRKRERIQSEGEQKRLRMWIQSWMTLWTDGMNRAVLSWELTARNILIDTRTDYYDKDGKAVRFSQTRDDVTLTYLFDDNENIIYIPERGADNSYAYYYYQDGNLICYSKNMTRNYEPLTMR